MVYFLTIFHIHACNSSLVMTMKHTSAWPSYCYFAFYKNATITKVSYFSKLYDHMTKEESFDSRQSQKMFFFSKTYRPYLELSQPPIQRVARTIFSLVEQLSLELSTNDFLVPRLRNNWARLKTKIFILGGGKWIFGPIAICNLYLIFKIMIQKSCSKYKCKIKFSVTAFVLAIHKYLYNCMFHYSLT